MEALKGISVDGAILVTTPQVNDYMYLFIVFHAKSIKVLLFVVSVSSSKKDK